MAIPSISGPARVSGSTTDPAAPDASARQRVPTTRTAAQLEVELDPVTQQPLPPRFPWLSRLSQELGAASGRRVPFEAAPVLGDHVDRSV